MTDAPRTLLALCRMACGPVDAALPTLRGVVPSAAIRRRIERELAAGADPEVEDDDGWRPLHVAVMGEQPWLVRTLIEAGASGAGRLLGQDGGTALALGLFHARPLELLAPLTDMPEPDSLRIAAALGRDLEAFFEADGSLTADATVGEAFHRPLDAFPPWRPSGTRQEVLDHALSWAARNGQIDAMAALVDRGADVNANPYRGTPLLWAVYADAEAAATWLLDHGADADLRHDFGGSEHGTAATAMHLAAQYGSLRCLRLLLDRGADPTIRDGGFDSTPRGWALHAGTHEAALMLLEATD